MVSPPEGWRRGTAGSPSVALTHPQSAELFTRLETALEDDIRGFVGVRCQDGWASARVFRCSDLRSYERANAYGARPDRHPLQACARTSRYCPRLSYLDQEPGIRDVEVAGSNSVAPTIEIIEIFYKILCLGLGQRNR